MSSTKRLYGLDWDASWSEVYVDLVCAKKWREFPYKHGSLLDPYEHLLRACKALYTPAEFSISPWTEEHAVDWTTEEFCITWGGASCSKSNDYGNFCLLDWITDPTLTVTLMASTTREMLKLRSYEAVVRYFNILKRNPYFIVPGKESRTSCAILNSNDPDSPEGAQTPKASIRGVAVNDGGSIQGAHLPYVRLILDEMALMKQKTFDDRVNLSIGASKDFKFIGLANPESRFDISAKAATPIDGWNSVDEHSTSWRSVYGQVRHHNGFDSPSLKNPELYPYLVSQKQIDKVIREEHGNEDSIQVWKMIKGFPAPQGMEDTVLTEADLITFGAQDGSTWAAGIEPVRVAALDAAFTHGGDGCTLQYADVGRIVPGIAAIVPGPLVYLEIAASSKLPVSAQILGQVRELLQEWGVNTGLLAVDDSGTQSIADVIEMGIAPGVTRYNYANVASDLLTVGGQVKFCDKYADKITELWVLAAEFVRARQVRNINLYAAQYLTMRRFRRRQKNAKVGLESKEEFKKRIAGRSPDEADVFAMLCGIVRDKLGFCPGKSPQPYSMVQHSVVQPSNFPKRLQLKSSYGARSNLKGYT